MRFESHREFSNESPKRTEQGADPELLRFELLSKVRGLESVAEDLEEAYLDLEANSKDESFATKLQKKVDSLDFKAIDAVLMGSDERLKIIAMRSVERLAAFEDQRIYPSNEAEVRFRDEVRGAFSTINTKLKPSFEAVLGDEKFLSVLEQKCEQGYWSSTDIEFAEYAATKVSDEKAEKVYKVFSKADRYATDESVLRSNSRFVDLAARFGADEEKERIEQLLYKVILSRTDEFKNFGTDLHRDWLVNVSWLKSSPKMFEIVIKAVEQSKEWFKNKYGFQIRQVTKGEVVPIDLYPDLIGTIAEIEDTIPGGSKILSDEYGIRCFYRYPAGLLIRQLKEQDSDMPYGVVSYPYADYNRAMTNAGVIVPSLDYQLEKGGMRLKIIESGGPIDFAKKLIRLNRKFGDEYKISFLLVNAHGEADNFLLSEGKGGKRRIEKSMLNGDGTNRLRELFVDDPEVALLSCSTGKSGGIGETIAKKYGVHVIAPNTPTGIEKVHVHFDEDGRPHFEPEFSDKGARTEYGPVRRLAIF
jgi:hypothetical protein